MAEQVTFGIGIGEAFKEGFNGWKSNIVPLAVGGVVPLAVTLAFSTWASEFNVDGQVQQDWRWFALNFVGWVLAGTLSYPWYMYALRAADGEEINLGEPFETPKRFLHQFVASFWFFAGFLLGIRFFLLPAIAVLVLYAFYGYLIADSDKGGTWALGTSVRMGEKRRIGLFGISVLFMIFNFFGLFPGVAVQQMTLRPIVAVLGLVVTASITLVSGAHIYRVFRGFLNE